MDKYEKESFSLPICQMIADECEQDLPSCLALIYLANNSSEQVTIATLAEKVKTKRKVGVRDDHGHIRSYKKELTKIGRPKAERIVEKLVFAGLVKVTPHLPLKLLSITIRGQQVLLALAKRHEELGKLIGTGGSKKHD